VDAVVEGAVLRSGNKIRITAKLIQARVDKHPMADTYQGTSAMCWLAESWPVNVRQSRVLSPEQQAVLRTRGLSTQRPTRLICGRQPDATVDGFHHKIAYFERALAERRTTLKLADWPMHTCSWGTWSRCLLRKRSQGPRAKLKALRPGGLGRSSRTVGDCSLLRLGFQIAEKEFQRALVLNQILCMLTAIQTFLARWGGRMKRSSKKYVSVRLIRSRLSGGPCNGIGRDGSTRPSKTPAVSPDRPEPLRRAPVPRLGP
jgi:hypothetical protein